MADLWGMANQGSVDLMSCPNGHPPSGTPYCPQCGAEMPTVQQEHPEPEVSQAPEWSGETHQFLPEDGPVPAHRHPKGGGWVANTATVADTAYVGRQASVFDFAQVLDRASRRRDGVGPRERRCDGQRQDQGEAVVGHDAQSLRRCVDCAIRLRVRRGRRQRRFGGQRVGDGDGPINPLGIRQG